MLNIHTVTEPSQSYMDLLYNSPDDTNVRVVCKQSCVEYFATFSWHITQASTGLLGGSSLLVMFIGREFIVGDVYWEGDHCW